MVSVLLLEDNPELSEKYEKSLKNSGFEVYPSNGSDLKNILNRHVIDLIISDTILKTRYGDQYGHELCRQLLEDERTKRVMNGTLIIGMSIIGDYKEYWRGVASNFLHKEDVDDLGSVVRSIYSSFKGTRKLPKPI